jgi:DegV family protein with EDD domain
MQTVIITDSCSDLPLKYVNENNIPVISLTYNFRGKENEDDLGKTMEYKEFYDGVRSGEMPTTSQINVFTYTEEFKKHISQGKSIIYIGFSSALSGSVNSANLARQTLLDEYKDADISVIDSKCASMGQGLLVYYANEMLKKGQSKEEIVKWVEENKLRLNHWFTVEDLNHLKRGGRVSAATAFIGTILDIKPVLHVDDEGRLIPVTKVKGRKKSIRMLFDKMKERIQNPDGQVIFISHGDSIDDAKHLEKLILDEYKVKEVVMNYVGPVIGAHSGPGTIALFFMGDRR